MSKQRIPPPPSGRVHSVGTRARRQTISVALSPGLERPRVRPGRLVLGFALATALVVTGGLWVKRRVEANVSARPPAAAIVDPSVVPVVPEQPPMLPPPTETELAALDSGTAEAVGEALRALRGRAVTDEGLRAVDAASRRLTDPELQRRMTCYRVRGEAPIDVAFAALPSTPRADAAWSGDGASCLVDAIAARATEAPERALPLLVDAALERETEPLLKALALLDPDALPAPVTEALASGVDGPRGRAAMRIAIALGAAAKWPERVTAWLEDDDRRIRLLAHAALAAQTDDASQRMAAQAIAADRDDVELTRRAAELIGKGAGFDRQLAAVASDIRLPASVRAYAAELVSLHGGPSACRMVTTLVSAEPALKPELGVALARIEQRFGGRIQTAEAR